MTNLQQRTITGFMLAAGVLSLIYLGAYTFLLLIAVINLGAMLEFYRLLQVSTRGAAIGTLTGSSLLIIVILILNGSADWQLILLGVPLLFVTYLNELYAGDSQPFKNLAYTFMALLYVCLPLCLFAAVAFLPIGKDYNAQIVSGCFLMIWASDTDAYVVGKYFGSRPLFIRISPHKTWEGSAGGLMASLLGAVAISHYFEILSFAKWLALAVIIVISGTFGDFFKSMLKRSVHVKDTSTLLPGHGGILDRFDSLLGSSPFIFSYLVLYGYAKI